MQQKKVGFIVFIWMFFCQSVDNTFALGVDFIETAHFNEDGSGQFSIEVSLVNTSKLISLLRYVKFNKDYHHNIAKSIGYNALSNAKKCLNKITDISKVHVHYNKKLPSVRLVFSFHNIHALNKAIRKINKGLDPPKITYFSLDDELFVRQDMNGIAQKVLFYQKNDNCKIKSLDLASCFMDTTYKTRYTFHKEIKDYSNPLSKLTKDKKTIHITHYVFAPDQIEESIGNCVHFSK